MVFARRKCALHIAVAFTGGKIRLRRSATNAPERGGDRQTHMTCEVFRLIESAFASSRRVERHRHRDVGIGENVCASLPHQCTERLGQRSSALVLERMNNRSESPII